MPTSELEQEFQQILAHAEALRAANIRLSAEIDAAIAAIQKINLGAIR